MLRILVEMIYVTAISYYNKKGHFHVTENVLIHSITFRGSVSDYIIPPMPPPGGIIGVSSLILATTDSVVKRVDATLVAF